MKIVINDKVYEIDLDLNTTTADILTHLPFEMEMAEYAGHEFYGTLPFTPANDRKQTSHLLAGHVYYWDGGNSFVINYKECDITPFKSVHIGEFNDKSIIEALKAGRKAFSAKVIP